jgi:hypothetical protein
MHIIPKGASVRVIPAPEDWPTTYTEIVDGVLKDAPEKLETLKLQAAMSIKELNALVLEMSTENPALTRSSHARKYREFVQKQQRLLQMLAEADNQQNWCPEEKFASGEINMSDVRIIRGGTVHSVFLTSAGDRYFIEYSDSPTVVATSTLDVAAKTEEPAAQSVTVVPHLKKGLQSARRIETGVERSRVVFYDAWTSEVSAEQTADSAVVAYPDPADVFGPVYATRGVEVEVRDFKFDGDKMGPPGTGCCGGTRKLHYKYNFGAGDGKKAETLYVYADA